ncbi:MAG: histidinol-phosphatase family [Clostridia bacterium]|nr:histidinol-phosphatase family [Clostridia bacterium]
MREIGLAEHEWYKEALKFETFTELRQMFPGLEIRVGLEIDFRRGRQDLGSLVACPWDYLIGSVHEIDGWSYDEPGEEDGFAAWDIDELYRRYFQLVAEVAASGYFQIVGHLDLIKLYGHRSRRPVVELAEGALRAIARAGMAVEINAAGLFRPVKELYPAPELLSRCFALNIPVTFGSDAHEPDQVGRGRAEALELLRRVGYTRLVGFKQQEMYTRNL